MCSICGEAKGGSTCGECKSAEYCSRECQKADWREHKNVCATFKRLGALERTFAAQEKRLDVVAAKLQYAEPKRVENPCFCCGLQRAAITDVMLSCCGLVLHGMCLAEKRASGECPRCGDPLPSAPDELYERATALTTRNKYHLHKGRALVPEDICDVYNMHLEAAKQGHAKAQMRVYEAHWMGVIVERNVDVAIYFLSLAAAHWPVTLASAHAKILLGDFHFERRQDLQAQNAYYGAVQHFAPLSMNMEVACTCAKIFNRMGEIMRRRGDMLKAMKYFEHAVVFDEGNAGYRYDLGAQHAIEGRFDEAERQHRACLHLNPKHALAQYAVGFLLAKKGDKKAAAFYVRAQQLGHMGAAKQLAKLQIK